MKIKHLYIPLYPLVMLIAGLGLLSSCGSEKNAAEEALTEESEDVIVLDENDPRLQQIQTAGVDMRPFPGEIACNGVIDVPPQSLATLGVAVGGYIRDIRPIPGDFVQKGALIAVLEHPEYIRMQQEYLEAQSQYQYLEKELARQQTLRSADAGAAKNLEKSESEFGSLAARLAGLRQQLKLLNIRTDQLSPGTLSSRIEVRAPFSGYITEVYANMGKFIGPEEGICELVDRSHLHLELQIFDKDITRVREGQKLVAHISGKEYKGFIKTVGQKVDKETHTLGVHAHVEDESPAIKPGVYASVRIQTEGETLPALPESAIMTEDEEHYVYLREGKGSFRRMHVHTGLSAGGFTALETRLPEGAEVVIAGAGSLQTQTK